MLGGQVCETFGDRLPFLMKVLAVDEPLSLQVHPSTERAQIGHARESRNGVPVDSPRRNYKDPWHKPELVFALTRFEGMAGFREVAKSAELLRLLEISWADEVASRLGSGPAYQSLRSVVTDTTAMSGPVLEQLLGDLATSVRDAERFGSLDPETTRVFANVLRLVERYPRDPGVLVTLLLNNIVLAPGEAMFVDAGVVHSYVSGTAAEIMASSDNVLRAGLTPKHIDVDELLHVTDFTPIPPPRWAPSERSADFSCFEPPVTEFNLMVGRSPLRRLPASGPRVVLALDGSVKVSTRTQSLALRKGQSVFVAHDDGAFEVAGPGSVAIGAVPT